MKSLYLIFLLTFGLFISCSKTDNQQKQETSLVGTWQLIEVYEAFGENGNWNPLEDGYFYTFNEDGTMSSNRFNCQTGIYEIEMNENLEQRKITISFNCNGTQHQGTLRMPFMEEYLILIDEISCDEGCAEKYVKISNQ